MEKRVRDLLFEPLRDNTLSAIIPDFTYTSTGKEISAPAQLVRQSDQFQFILHFNTAQPPRELQSLLGGFMSEADQRTVCGQINGELPFRCDDVFPPSTMTTRSRGTSITILKSNRLHLVAEGSDAMTTGEFSRIISRPIDDHCNRQRFTAHLVYHGPKLLVHDARTEILTRNDFLGEATTSTADTHQFKSARWEGALIQQQSELHLHLRSREMDLDPSSQQIIDLVDRTNQAVGFVLGFHPWPAYRELRINHQVVERWLSPRFDLPTTYLVPASETMWAHFYGKSESAIHSIIPTIVDGLAEIPVDRRERLITLLWHFRSGNNRDLPSSTQLLMLCAVLDGLMKLIAGAGDPSEKPATDKTWRKASDTLGLSWERWTTDVFKTWGKHRHLLAHGWLWLGEDLEGDEFFVDHARLGCAFVTFVAAYCGYEGPVLADPFENRIITIRDIKA